MIVHHANYLFSGIGVVLLKEFKISTDKFPSIYR